MAIKVYEYKNCGTCKKALQFLDRQGIRYEKIPIREQPPSKDELRRMLNYVGDSRKLFNTSGQDYKAFKLKDKLATMSIDAQLALLSKNGNLVKRPFVLRDKDGWVGFNAETWAEKFR